jgi:hypothetical protein
MQAASSSSIIFLYSGRHYLHVIKRTRLCQARVPLTNESQIDKGYLALLSSAVLLQDIESPSTLQIIITVHGQYAADWIICRPECNYFIQQNAHLRPSKHDLHYSGTPRLTKIQVTRSHTCEILKRLEFLIMTYFRRAQWDEGGGKNTAGRCHNRVGRSCCSWSGSSAQDFGFQLDSLLYTCIWSL